MSPEAIFAAQESCFGTFPTRQLESSRVKTKVLHIVRNKNPYPGTVSVCLPRLMDALQAYGFESVFSDQASELVSGLNSVALVHIHGWGYPLSVESARKCKAARKPYVLSPLGRLTPGFAGRRGWLESVRNFFLERPLVRSAAALTAIDELDRRNLEAARLHPRTVTLPYGLDFTHESPRSDEASGESKSILMLGELAPTTGCVMLLKAVAELGERADGWTVVLAGADEGNWRPRLQAAIRRKGGEGRVDFREAPTLEEQLHLLSKASLVAALGLHPAPPVSIMQAIKAGVPVIATRPSAPAGLNGAIRVCDPNRSEVKAALLSAMASLDQGRPHAEQARQWARRELDWGVLAPRYAELYRSAM